MHPRTSRRSLLSLERLEARELLRAVVWLDFGFGLPGGSVTVSDTEMRNGSINGPQVFGNSHTLISLTQTVQNQRIDLNGDSQFNQADADILASRVMTTAQRMLAPFDIALFQGNAPTLNRIGDDMRGQGTRDAYILIAGDDPPANPAFGWGQVDMGNGQDNLGFAFADEIIRSLGAGSAVTALALVAAHEAAHTFGLDHTSAGPGPLAVGDVMGAPNSGQDNRRFDIVNFLTRYPMPFIPTGTQNSYDVLAASNVGASPVAPAYVTGTGAHDRITIRRVHALQASVFVEAFADAAMTNRLGTHSYTINPTNNVIVEAGVGDDHVAIDTAIGGQFWVRGGLGTDTVFVDMPSYLSNAVVTDASVNAPSQVHYNDFNETEGVVVRGTMNNNVNVHSTRAGIPVSVQGMGTVTVGTGALSALQGAVTISNPPSYTSLTIDNSTDTFTHPAVNVTATGVTGLAPVPINWVQNDVRSVTIRGGNGSNTYHVLNTPQNGVAGGVTTTLTAGWGADTFNVRATTGTLVVNGGDGRDFFNIGNTANRLDDLRAGVALDGGAGVDDVVVRDTGSITAYRYSILAGLFTRFGGAFDFQFPYVNMEAVSAGTGAGDDLVNVNGGGGSIVHSVTTGAGRDTVTVPVNAVGSVLSLATEDGDDTVNIGQNNQVNIRGVINVAGGTGTNTLNVTDRTGTVSRTYALTANRVTVSTYPLTVDHSGFQTVTVTGGTTDDTFHVGQNSLAGLPASLVLSGGAGVNVLNVNDSAGQAAQTFTLTPTTVRASGGPMTITYADMQGGLNVTGGDGDDIFEVTGPDTTATRRLNGGGGTNALDYSAYNANLYVNLRTGHASGVFGGVSNVQWALGGPGNDVLVGGGGNALAGGPGRDLLIGGAAPSVLFGDFFEDLGEDLIIAGTTVYDTSVIQLVAIRDYWASGDSYETRVARLTAGTGVPRLDASTVTSNGGPNLILGGGGRDFVFARPDVDIFIDPEGGETIVPI